MRTSFRFVLLTLAVLALSLSAQAKPEYVPDYFPAPLGAEWHYELKSSAGYNLKLKNVVSERTDAAKAGYNILISSFSPQESKTYYLKKPGWVFALKTEMPASSYAIDYVADKEEIMNPLKVGATWEYKGKGVSSTGEQDWVQSWKVEGVEDVTVPAGTYKAVKVTSTSNVAGNVTKYTFWYVDRVGAVRVLTEVSGMTNDMLLTKVSMPK